MTRAAIDRTLIALADPTRRGVIELLRSGPRRAGELADALQMQKPAMTRHLRLLRESGLVHEDGLREDARVRVYRLRRAPFSALREWLDEVESFWSFQLEGFKEHAERTRARSGGKAPRRPRGLSGRAGSPLRTLTRPSSAPPFGATAPGSLRSLVKGEKR